MLVPIGKITEDEKIAAVIIYDLKKYKRRLMSINELNSKVFAENVCGLTLCIDNNGEITTRRTKKFLWDNIPECNGKCEPEIESDRNTLILLGSYDRRNKKGYIVSDIFGQVEVLGSNDIKEVMKSKMVVGAKLGNDGRIMNFVNNRFELDQLKELGYVLKDNKWIHIGKEFSGKDGE